MQKILVSLFLLFPIILCQPEAKTNLGYLVSSSESEKLVKSVGQDIYFNYCSLQISKVAIYICAHQLYVFSHDPLTNQFSRHEFLAKFIRDADMDDNSIIITESNSIAVLLNLHLISHINFNRGYPLLSKVKSKGEYALIATIMKTRALKAGEVSMEEEIYNKDETNQTESHKEQYYVSTFFRGSVPSSYRTKFPESLFDFQLEDESFKQAVIYNDPSYDHDYFLVGLEKGWVVIFKSEFQNAQMKFIKAVPPAAKDMEILEMTVVDSYLFVLFGTNLKKDLSVGMYRLLPKEDFEVREDCLIKLSHDVFSQFTPQLQVKLFNGIFAIMINFPGEKIVVYHLQKPSAAFSILQCRKESDTILYKDYVKDVRIGFTFEYISRLHISGVEEHVIVLSPITSSLKRTYEILYCMPNTYRDPNRGCIPCEQGFSIGGFSSTCLPCSAISDKDSDWLQISDVVETNCPLNCKDPEKFGKECLSCPKYMKSLGAILPPQGYWGINSKGECDLKCKRGFVNTATGTCITVNQTFILKNHCSQITDCMNCSMTQTCSWCGGSCQQSSKCSIDIKSPKMLIFDDMFLPALECRAVEACGQTEYTGPSGTITFGTESLYKNQLCQWYIRSTARHKNRIELRITVEQDLLKEVENLPVIYLHSANYNSTTGLFDRSLTQVILKGETAYVTLVATELTLYPLVQENIIKRGGEIKIEYKVRPINNLLEGVLILFKWLYYLIFLCIALTFTMSLAQRISNYYRRRRLLVQLQRIGNFNRLSLNEENANPVDVSQVMKNGKIVCKVVHDEAKLNKYDQTECSICLEEFKNGDNLAEFACEHVFHVACFEKWIKSANIQVHIKCPVCNRVLI